jgi:hypothetical protein
LSSGNLLRHVWPLFALSIRAANLLKKPIKDSAAFTVET